MVVEEGRQPEDEFFSLHLIGRRLRSRDGLAAAPLFLLFLQVVLILPFSLFLS